MSDKRIKVLVVDDSQALLESITPGLEVEGFSVFTALNALEGVKQIQEHNPDIVILDVILPDKSGFELCKELKKNTETAKIPIIVFTGDATIDIEQGFSVGADDCIFKPINMARLITSIRKLVKKKHKILLVEDDREICNVLVNIVTKHHFEINVVNDGIDIVRKIKEEQPDLILLDITLSMPPHGVEICEKIKHDPEISAIPVVMLTADESTESIDKCFQHGADDYIFKPFNIVDLLSKIRKHIT